MARGMLRSHGASLRKALLAMALAVGRHAHGHAHAHSGTDRTGVDPLAIGDARLDAGSAAFTDEQQDHESMILHSSSSKPSLTTSRRQLLSHSATASCPNNCEGSNCYDAYLASGVTCSALEETYGCDCSGCDCSGQDGKLLPPVLPPVLPPIYTPSLRGPALPPSLPPYSLPCHAPCSCTSVLRPNFRTSEPWNLTSFYYIWWP